MHAKIRSHSSIIYKDESIVFLHNVSSSSTIYTPLLEYIWNRYFNVLASGACRLRPGLYNRLHNVR